MLVCTYVATCLQAHALLTFLTGKTRNNNFNCQFQTNTNTPTHNAPRNSFSKANILTTLKYVCVYIYLYVVWFCKTFATTFSCLFPKNNFNSLESIVDVGIYVHMYVWTYYVSMSLCADCQCFSLPFFLLWKLCSITACLLPFWHLIEICYRRRIHQWYIRPSKRWLTEVGRRARGRGGQTRRKEGRSKVEEQPAGLAGRLVI